MEEMIITLFLAGLLAGLIQYFVDFKGLPLYQPPAAASFQEEEKPGFWQTIFKFVKDHWQLFGYLTIGVAGAFLTPLIYEMTNHSLGGIEKFKMHAECIFTQVNGKPVCPGIDGWYYLILFGYGIVFGYSSVRIIRSIGSLIIVKLTVKQEEQQKKLDEQQKKIQELENKILSLQKPQQTFSFADVDVTTNHCDDSDAKIELSNVAGFDSCEQNTNPKPWKIDDSRIAKSLAQLRSQVNAMAPNRSKLSDGWFGDAAHQETESDHNPWVWDAETNKGVVTAFDITHDVKNKCDCSVLAQWFEKNKDPRIKYVIWNKKKMYSTPVGGSAAWTWRAYNGTNPHDKHIHVSVNCDKTSYDSISNWTLS
ncbi:hypothetical protein [Flavobacterium sp. FlaQc-48]|uniref:hypothetical protein n=1 Tax=Flavobacterium sp. FlaQc-48 TaxID=3374181 RepID=UPI003757797D